MTLYTRGYRPYDGGFTARGPRFGPILREGFRQATRGKAFVVLSLVIVVIVVVLGFFLYFGAGPLKEVFKPPRRHRWDAPASPAEAFTPSFYLEAAVVLLHQISYAFVVLIALFVGSNLISDDLRARTLQLYLVRPITPFDYYLGKVLVPVAVFALVVLAPGLFLVVLAALLRPSEEMLSFLGEQGALVGAILLHFATLAAAYASIMVLYSAWTSRRLTAVVLGAVTLLGGEVLRTAVWRVEGGFADALRACSLQADASAILFRAMGREVDASAFAPYPSTTAAVVAVLAVTALAAWVVLRRARSVEVVA